MDEQFELFITNEDIFLMIIKNITDTRIFFEMAKIYYRKYGKDIPNIYYPHIYMKYITDIDKKNISNNVNSIVLCFNGDFFMKGILNKNGQKYVEINKKDNINVIRSKIHNDNIEFILYYTVFDNIHYSICDDIINELLYFTSKIKLYFLYLNGHYLKYQRKYRWLFKSRIC